MSNYDFSPLAGIDSEDLSFQHDRLERRVLAERLDRLIADSGGGVVMCLDAPWGEGKTTFVRMWMAEDSQRDSNYIYIDAFSNDQAEDPFIVVAAKILRFARSHHQVAGLEERLRRNAGRVAAGAAGVLGRAAVRAVSLGALDGKALLELGSVAHGLSRNSTDQLGALIEDELSSMVNAQGVVHEFREALGQLSRQRGEDAGPLVIIIDELDRCSPSFTMRLLERVKHLFLVPGVVFILVADRAQLGASVRHYYGQDFDAQGYLHKFFHINCSLPKRSGRMGDYRRYVAEVIRRTGVESQDAGDTLPECFCRLAEEFRLTLREVERVGLALSLYYRSGGVDADNWGYSVPLAVLRVRRPRDYALFAEGRVTLDTLEGVFPELFVTGDPYADYLAYCRDHFRWALASDYELSSISGEPGIEKVVSGYHGSGFVGRNQLLMNVCRVLDFFDAVWE